MTKEEEMAQELLQQLAKDHIDPFQIAKARIFAISANGFSRTLVTAKDVYEALDKAGNGFLADGEIGIGCETCGWASPVTKSKKLNNLAPSEHPQRRRVRLLTLITNEMSAGSALSFSDEPEEIITDAGKAHGSLADALMSVMGKLLYKNN